MSDLVIRGNLGSYVVDQLERRRITWYARMMRRGMSAQFILEALSDPAWPLDSRDRVIGRDGHCGWPDPHGAHAGPMLMWCPGRPELP